MHLNVVCELYILIFFCLCIRPIPYKIRDFNFGSRDQPPEEEQNNNDDQSNVVDQSSFAFSIMCIFFTVMYSTFATLVFYNSNVLLEESVADARDEIVSSSGRPGGGRNGNYFSEVNNAPGYIGGDRFGVRSYKTGGGGSNPLNAEGTLSHTAL